MTSLKEIKSSNYLIFFLDLLQQSLCCYFNSDGVYYFLLDTYCALCASVLFVISCMCMGFLQILFCVVVVGATMHVSFSGSFSINIQYTDSTTGKPSVSKLFRVACHPCLLYHSCSLPGS